MKAHITTQLISGKFLGAHLVHTALILVWAGTMSLFELSHFIPENLYMSKVFILLPHLALGGIYHAIIGAERLEERSL